MDIQERDWHAIVTSEIGSLRIEVQQLHQHLDLMLDRLEVESRAGFWTRFFRWIKRAWGDEKNATPTGNDRCRDDVWHGRRLVEEVEAGEGIW